MGDLTQRALYSPSMEDGAQKEGTSNLLKWARASTEDNRAQTSARLLEPGQHDGTSRVPFPVANREQYLSQIRGAGIPRRAATAPKQMVKLDELHGIQHTVNAERLSQHLGDPGLIKANQRAPHSGMPIDTPVVVKVGGKLYIHDGHHRLTAAKVRGASHARVRLVDLDAAATEGGASTPTSPRVG